jgi:uncharacterized Rmd1/YagE family protein
VLFYHDLDEEDVETEEFSYHYNSQYQPRYDATDWTSLTLLSRTNAHRNRETTFDTFSMLLFYCSPFRIYNDVITLKSAGNYMVKLTISHAIAQSVKMTLFEGLIENTINATKNIPQTMAETGKVPMSRYKMNPCTMMVYDFY